ncbi:MULTISPECIES: hypothetical protein [Mesorhizobium]|uniref:hypothetical protein n=1 Tax=Mesorhizobium TaxID=68287 RepID=UPI001FE53F03|nr:MULTISPECIES: hypothetical protein [Mesorhizobium]
MVFRLKELLGKRFDEEVQFFKAWQKDKKGVGALIPTSIYAAHRMASVINPRSGMPIIELGAGTGVITKAILERGIKPHQLVSQLFHPNQKRRMGLSGPPMSFRRLARHPLVPPIYKLIAAMEAPGFNWPTCPQADSSAARFGKYEDCPSGWQAVGSSESDRPGLGQERNICRIAADRLSLPVVFKNKGLGGYHGDGSRPVQIEIDGKVVAATTQTAGNDRGHSLGNGPTYLHHPSTDARKALVHRV